MIRVQLWLVSVLCDVFIFCRSICVSLGNSSFCTGSRMFSVLCSVLERDVKHLFFNKAVHNNAHSVRFVSRLCMHYGLFVCCMSVADIVLLRMRRVDGNSAFTWRHRKMKQNFGHKIWQVTFQAWFQTKSRPATKLGSFKQNIQISTILQVLFKLCVCP
jgi:hypothetical protein